jgi:uncharacterized protein
MERRVRVVNETRGAVLAERAVVADTFWRRFKGLLGRDGLAPGEGMVIEPCGSIHMLGMRFAIDALHLDDRGRVVKVVRELAPNRLGPLVRRSRTVVELPAGTAAATGTAEGDRVVVVAP